MSPYSVGRLDLDLINTGRDDAKNPTVEFYDLENEKLIDLRRNIPNLIQGIPQDVEFFLRDTKSLSGKMIFCIRYDGGVDEEGIQFLTIDWSNPDIHHDSDAKASPLPYTASVAGKLCKGSQ